MVDERCYTPEQQDAFGEAWMTQGMFMAFVAGLAYVVDRTFFHGGVDVMEWLGLMFVLFAVLNLVSGAREMYRAQKRREDGPP